MSIRSENKNKKEKKRASLLAMILVIALLCGATTVSAATKGKPGFATTSAKAFSDYMTAEDYVFDYEGIYENSNGKKEDHFDIVFEGDYLEDIEFNVYFDSDNEGAAFYIWDYVTFKPAQAQAVQDLCNRMNLQYRFCKFYVEDDNTVTVQSDAIFFGNDIGEICECFICTTASIADEAYPEFEELLG